MFSVQNFFNSNPEDEKDEEDSDFDSNDSDEDNQSSKMDEMISDRDVDVDTVERIRRKLFGRRTPNNQKPQNTPRDQKPQNANNKSTDITKSQEILLTNPKLFKILLVGGNSGMPPNQTGSNFLSKNFLQSATSSRPSFVDPELQTCPLVDLFESLQDNKHFEKYQSEFRHQDSSASLLQSEKSSSCANSPSKKDISSPRSANNDKTSTDSEKQGEENFKSFFCANSDYFFETFSIPNTNSNQNEETPTSEDEQMNIFQNQSQKQSKWKKNSKFEVLERRPWSPNLKKSLNQIIFISKSANLLSSSFFTILQSQSKDLISNWFFGGSRSPTNSLQESQIPMSDKTEDISVSKKKFFLSSLILKKNSIVDAATTKNDEKQQEKIEQREEKENPEKKAIIIFFDANDESSFTNAFWKWKPFLEKIQEAKQCEKQQKQEEPEEEKKNLSARKTHRRKSNSFSDFAKNFDDSKATPKEKQLDFNPNTNPSIFSMKKFFNSQKEKKKQQSNEEDMPKISLPSKNICKILLGIEKQEINEKRTTETPSPQSPRSISSKTNPKPFKVDETKGENMRQICELDLFMKITILTQFGKVVPCKENLEEFHKLLSAIERYFYPSLFKIEIPRAVGQELKSNSLNSSNLASVSSKQDGNVKSLNSKVFSPLIFSSLNLEAKENFLSFLENKKKKKKQLEMLAESKRKTEENKQKEDSDKERVSKKYKNSFTSLNPWSMRKKLYKSRESIKVSRDSERFSKFQRWKPPRHVEKMFSMHKNKPKVQEIQRNFDYSENFEEYIDYSFVFEPEKYKRIRSEFQKRKNLLNLKENHEEIQEEPKKKLMFVEFQELIEKIEEKQEKNEEKSTNNQERVSKSSKPGNFRRIAVIIDSLETPPKTRIDLARKWKVNLESTKKLVFKHEESSINFLRFKRKYFKNSRQRKRNLFKKPKEIEEATEQTETTEQKKQKLQEMMITVERTSMEISELLRMLKKTNLMSENIEKKQQNQKNPCITPNKRIPSTLSILQNQTPKSNQDLVMISKLMSKSEDFDIFKNPTTSKVQNVNLNSEIADSSLSLDLIEKKVDQKKNKFKLRLPLFKNSPKKSDSMSSGTTSSDLTPKNHKYEVDEELEQISCKKTSKNASQNLDLFNAEMKIVMQMIQRKKKVLKNDIDSLGNLVVTSQQQQQQQNEEIQDEPGELMGQEEEENSLDEEMEDGF